ncbi:hypothetical protein L873DRAFT_1805811 [Choiromyces venosus 120613-1]|uniref:TFIIS N-terminal domain-containing protein n=1 Tax=Choiromyces venosus 120613-1 TaxID=1336337 RepID=A0A3N4JPC7_9PEZI|nr:hypothetical protein L873DRAFT_1805811 [Choiromyces venosus 120613-1]
MSELETLERRGSPPPSALTEENLNALSPPHETAAKTSDNESVLSDIDEEIFQEFDDYSLIGRIVPIDEETVHTIGKYKKKLDPSQLAEQAGKKEKRRRDIKRRRDDVEERVGEPEPQEQELTAEEKARRELDQRMDAALKGPKKKKKKGEDLEEMNDDLITALKQRMIDAANRDQEAIVNGQQAVHKLAMLEEVKDILQRPNLMATAMDNNLLEAMKRWLEPLPNKALPAYGIQKVMFEIMGKMKITTDYLRESGIGKVVMFYTKDKRPQLHIKREANRLVRDWSRPILGRSDDYHSREIPMAHDGDSRHSRPKQRGDDEEANPLAPPDRNKNRTRVPQAMPRSYEIAPASRVVQGHNAYARPIGAAGDDIIRRMKAKKQAANKGKKSGMIIG